MYKLLFISLLLAIKINTAPLDPKKVLVAVNCGSSQQTIQASEGFKYLPDAKYVQGESNEADYNLNGDTTDADIKFTVERDVYMFERHTYSQMTYKLPIKNGVNTIILKFAEMYFNQRGKRVFDISIGSKVVLKDFDVYAEVGKFAASDKYLEVEVKKDKVYYNGELMVGALQSGKIKISFTKGKADNPIVQGIIVYGAPLKESNYDEYTHLRTTWSLQKEMQKAKKEEAQIKQLLQIQKKKEKIIIRNDQLEIEQQQQNETKSVEGNRKGFIRTLLMSPLGVLLETIVIAWGAIFVYRNIFQMATETKLS